MSGSGYAVHADELQSSSKQVSGLVSECKQIADLVTAAASALAGAAGNPTVESAALSMGTSALKQYIGAGAGLQHTAEQLAATAETYTKAESNSVSSVRGVAFRPEG